VWLKEDEERTGLRVNNALKKGDKGCTMHNLRKSRVKFCDSEASRGLPWLGGGFTLVEIIVVLVILAIASMMVIPVISSAENIQVRSASNMLASDLEYAKNMSISMGQNYSVVFINSSSYKVCDQGGSTIEHPVSKKSYVVDFSGDSRLDKVSINQTQIMPDSATSITFDYLGSPYSGSGVTAPLDSGSVELKAGGMIVTVSVEAVTGYISISN